MKGYALLIFVSGMAIGIAARSAADYLGVAVYPLPTSDKPLEMGLGPWKLPPLEESFQRGYKQGAADERSSLRTVEFDGTNCSLMLDKLGKAVFVNYLDWRGTIDESVVIRLDDDGLPIVGISHDGKLRGGHPLLEVVRAAEKATTVKQKRS